MLKSIVFYLSHFGWAAMIVALVGYLLGSISFAIIITKIYIHKDIRDFGSGNAGATNVLRVVGKKAAAWTFLGDFAKTFFAMLLGSFIFKIAADTQNIAHAEILLGKYGSYISGMSCFWGHIFPVYFRFRGGKGVISSSAIILLMDWRIFCIELALFLIVFFAKKIVSLASICAAATFPLVTFLITYFVDYRGFLALGGVPYSVNYVIVTTVTTGVIGWMIVWMHRSNIRRLLAGTEKPISFHKS